MSTATPLSIATALDRLGAPQDVGQAKARLLLKRAGVKVRNATLVDAIRWRKSRCWRKDQGEAVELLAQATALIARATELTTRAPR